VTHKTEAGAVAVNLADERAVRAALDGFATRLGQVEQYEVQEFVGGGTELAVGAAKAEGLGATVMFGLGGIFIEALRDVRFGLAPLTDAAADRMINGIRLARLLGPFRGQPGLDLAKVRDVLLRVGRLAADHPSIAELDLNPVLAFPDGAKTRVVDVRLRVAK
jgi:acyl-CoA synthetase (NDP forming)